MTTRPTGSARIDWAAVRQRLERAEHLTAVTARPSPEQAARILAERAEALARTAAEPASVPSATLECLRFRLGRGSFALETRYVLEVRALEALTRVPGVPPPLRGVATLRGEILAVFDLRGLLDPGAGLPGAGERLIVCGETSAQFGVPADAVEGVIRLPHRAPSPVSGELDREFVRAVHADGIVLLDGAALLASSRLVVDQS